MTLRLLRVIGESHAGRQYRGELERDSVRNVMLRRREFDGSRHGAGNTVMQISLNKRFNPDKIRWGRVISLTGK